MKILKVVGIVLGALIALFVLAAVIVAIVVDPNEYKAEISTAVKDATGRELVFGGDIELTFFPWLGVELGPLTVGNAPGFGPEPFARVEAARVNFRLLPLFIGKVRAGTVYLGGLELDLRTAADGSNNWSDLVGEGAEPPPTETRRPAATAPVAALTVGGLRVVDAQLRWRNDATGESYAVENLNIESGALNWQDPIPVQIAFDARSAAPPLGAHAEFHTRVLPDIDARKLRLEDLELNLEISRPDLPKPLELQLSSDVALDLEQGTLTVSPLASSMAGVSLTGSIEGSGVLDTPVFNMRIEVNEFNPRSTLEQLGIEPPATADENVLRSASAAVHAQLSADAAKLQELRLVLDDTTLQGTMSVTDFAQPAIAFALNVGTLDLDRYLPPSVKSEAAAPAAIAAPALLPVNTLRALDLDGTLHADELKVSGARLTDVEVSAKARNGLLEIDPTRATLYDGRAQGLLRVNARDEQPVVVIEEQLIGVEAGALIKDMTGYDVISGTADLSARLSFAGNTETAARRSLKGRLAFDMSQTIIKKSDIETLIRQTVLPKLGQAESRTSANKQTQLTEFRGTINIDQGVARNDDFVASSARLALTGKGQADLVQEQLDYRIFATIPREYAEALKGVPVPIHLRGPITSPKVTVESDEVLRAIAKLEAREAVERREGETRQQLEEKKDELKDKLRGLFR